MANRYFREVILNRQTTRNFKEESVSIEDLMEIEKTFENGKWLIPDIKVALKIVGEKGKLLDGAIGYNGFPIKAPNYVVILSETKDRYLENAGYIGQCLSLKATELGLAACWQTVRDSDKIKEVFAIKSDFEVVSVIGIGYNNDEGQSLRLDIKSPSDVDIHRSGVQKAPKVSLEEMVSYERFGNKVTDVVLYEDLEEALLAVCHAQSFFGLQPYRVILGEHEIYLVGLADEQTGEADKALNYGIVMYNFANVLGSTRAETPKWSFEPSEKDLALPENVSYVAKCGY